jgi:hypothetical protein
MALGLLLTAVWLPAGAADTTGSAGEPSLRRWHLGVQAVGTWRSRYDVFRLPDMPPGQVDDIGLGGGFGLGRRFGDRFLLGMQLTAARHDLDGSEHALNDFSFLLTGSVLFRTEHTLQPYLRGGFGAGGEVISLADEAGHLAAIGTTAVMGGGLQIRLGDRVSLDLESVATFTNFLEVVDESEDDLWPDDSWQVRISNRGWRLGAGLVFWF